MRCCRVICLATTAALLATQIGCVTTAEQTASQNDIRVFGQVVSLPDIFTQTREEELETLAREMVETPIQFYGVVTDEDGQPIADAEVALLVFDRLVDPFTYPYLSFTEVPSVRSRPDGTFSVTGIEGAGLHVTVKKAGFKPVSPSQRVYVYAEAIRDGDVVLPTQAEPAVFTFEPRPPEAETRRVATGALQLPGDGAPLDVSLRQVSPYGIDADRRDLEVICSRDVQTQGENFTWKCRVTVPGGGVQPVRQIAFDRAPEQGYAEAIELGYRADDPDWDHRARRSLFLRLADNTYAWVVFRMRMRGDFFVAFDGVWNPTGSRLVD